MRLLNITHFYSQENGYFAFFGRQNPSNIDWNGSPKIYIVRRLKSMYILHTDLHLKLMKKEKKKKEKMTKEAKLILSIC